MPGRHTDCAKSCASDWTSPVRHLEGRVETIPAERRRALRWASQALREIAADPGASAHLKAEIEALKAEAAIELPAPMHSEATATVVASNQ